MKNYFHFRMTWHYVCKCRVTNHTIMFVSCGDILIIFLVRENAIYDTFHDSWYVTILIILLYDMFLTMYNIKISFYLHFIEYILKREVRVFVKYFKSRHYVFSAHGSTDLISLFKCILYSNWIFYADFLQCVLASFMQSKCPSSNFLSHFWR